MDVSMERLEVKRTPGHGLLEVQLSKPEQERSGDLYHTNGGGWVPYRLEERYVLQRKVGQGAYGVVWQALDKKTGRLVAVKKIENVFSDDLEAKRTLREVRLMRHFMGNKEILQLEDLLTDEPNKEGFKDLFVVTEFMDEGDLSSLCQRNGENWLPVHLGRTKWVIYNILKGLRKIHAAGVLHRDLRPKNILLGKGCVKIADFGMGRPTNNKNVKLSLMQFISSRYYTAPEGLVPNNVYTSAVDVWAVGCIMAEMILGQVFFKDARCLDQMKVVVNTLGHFTEEDMDSIAHGINEKFKVYLRTLQPTSNKQLKDFFPDLDENGFDLLSQMLTFNPTKRITVEKALQHAWFVDDVQTSNFHQNVIANSQPQSHNQIPTQSETENEIEMDDPETKNETETETETELPTEFNGDDIENVSSLDDIRELLWKEVEALHCQDKKINE